VNRFHNFFFRLSQKGRNEKRDSFYTAKCVSSVSSCRDETRLAVFSVPFPQNKFQTCFFQKGMICQTDEFVHISFFGWCSFFLLEWLYLLRSAKLCAVHNAQSGPLTGAKNLCAVAALPAALHLRLKNTSFGCRQLINKTQLRSAAAPALSSSVAVALCLPLPRAARPLLSAAATVLLSSPPPSLSSCSSPRISCRHPTPSSPSPLSFPFRLLIVVLSGGQSRCYRRWCRRCRHA
jgi:hypothetical protein